MAGSPSELWHGPLRTRTAVGGAGLPSDVPARGVARPLNLAYAAAGAHGGRRCGASFRCPGAGRGAPWMARLELTGMCSSASLRRDI